MAGDTAANAGMMELWATLPGAEGMPTWAKTVSASAGAAAFRVFLMPIDACKTILQGACVRAAARPVSTRSATLNACVVPGRS